MEIAEAGFLTLLTTMVRAEVPTRREVLEIVRVLAVKEVARLPLEPMVAVVLPDTRQAEGKIKVSEVLAVVLRKVTVQV